MTLHKTPPSAQNKFNVVSLGAQLVIKNIGAVCSANIKGSKIGGLCTNKL
jgi:hypothetical protein